ncbi:LYR motif-containing protein 4 isoform X1 [Aix galericulata]|nr:LYR motif-containing protein 4 isoform X1 [Aix galericulata]
MYKTHCEKTQTREHPPSSARPPPNAARPGPPRLWAPSGRGLAAASAARPAPPLTAPPRLAPPPCPCPCPATAGGWEASPRSGAAPCAAGGDRRPGREEPPAVGNMAAASRAQVLRLYRALLRESQRFGGYNYRCPSLRPRGGIRGGNQRGGEEEEEEVRGSPALCARPELGELEAGEGVLPRARWRWQAAGAAAPQGRALGQLQPCPGWARCLSPLPHAVPEVELKVWSTL